MTLDIDFEVERRLQAMVKRPRASYQEPVRQRQPRPKRLPPEESTGLRLEVGESRSIPLEYVVDVGPETRQMIERLHKLSGKDVRFLTKEYAALHFNFLAAPQAMIGLDFEEIIIIIDPLAIKEESIAHEVGHGLLRYTQLKGMKTPTDPYETLIQNALEDVIIDRDLAKHGFDIKAKFERRDRSFLDHLRNQGEAAVSTFFENNVYLFTAYWVASTMNPSPLFSDVQRELAHCCPLWHNRAREINRIAFACDPYTELATCLQNLFSYLRRELSEAPGTRTKLSTYRPRQR